MTPNPTRETIILEVAMALQADHGMKAWDDVGRAAKRRWVVRAQDLIIRCPTLVRALRIAGA